MNCGIATVEFPFNVRMRVRFSSFRQETKTNKKRNAKARSARFFDKFAPGMTAEYPETGLWYRCLFLGMRLRGGTGATEPGDEIAPARTTSLLWERRRADDNRYLVRRRALGPAEN